MVEFEELMRYAREKGFFYQSCEIYGGSSGFYDYGSLGTLLKRKWENLWRRYFLSLHENFWEVEPCEIMSKKVFVASGHLQNFNDPIVECKKCKQRFRADKLIEDELNIDVEGKSVEELTNIIKENNIRCPNCKGELSEVKWFNLMFPIFVGPESGNLFAELNNLLEKERKIKEVEKILKEVEKKEKFKTTDGLELITFIKEKFKDPSNLVLLFDESLAYIVDKSKKKAVVIDMFLREATIYGENVKEVIEKNIEKYEGIEDIEKEFNEFLEKIPTQVIKDVLDVKNLLEYYEESLKSRMFLRPETAQGAYVNFRAEYFIHREKLPLGLAIVGKAFRNEISPRQGLFRLREFTQAELQIFFDPEEWENSFEKYFDYKSIENEELILLPVKYRGKGEKFVKKVKKWKEELNLPEYYLYFLWIVQNFYLKVLKIPKDRIRFKELSEEEKAFYNKYHFDVEIYFESLKSWKEVAGVHYRTDHDLSGHQKVSKQKLSVKKGNKEFIPHVLELSFGVDRNVLALLDVFYKKEENRNVLKIPEHLAPIDVAVFPLVSNKEEIVKKAREVFEMLRKEFKVFYDESGSIGRRYRRQDEIGTPFCVTIDYQTLDDNTVTIRFRDTMEQIRVKIDELKEKLRKLLNVNF